MASGPFSSGGDQSGTSGVDGYSTGGGSPSSSAGGLNPAFGRSSRDLASDSGPAAAPQDLWSAPGTGTETTAADGPTANPDAASLRSERGRDESGARSHRKTDPDADPDRRLGLHPTTTRIVAPAQPFYPITGPKSRAATGAVAGLIGAAGVVAITYLLHAAGLVPAPASLAAATRYVVPRGGHSAGAYAAGVIGSLAAGASWGALFGLLVRRPTILKGMAFGLLPALFQCIVLAPLAGQGIFFRNVGPAAGTGFTLLFNVLIFGGAVGYYCGRWLRPPYAGAVDPDVTTAVPNP